VKRSLARYGNWVGVIGPLLLGLSFLALTALTAPDSMVEQSAVAAGTGTQTGPTPGPPTKPSTAAVASSAAAAQATRGARATDQQSQWAGHH